MTEKLVKLYVNDPMGGRCRANMEAAEKAREELGVKLLVVRNGSDEYYAESFPPPCPSVAVGDRVIVKDGTVDFDTLRDELLRDE